MKHLSLDDLSLFDFIEEQKQALNELRKTSNEEDREFIKLLTWALSPYYIASRQWRIDWLVKILPIDRLMTIKEQIKNGIDIATFKASDADVVIFVSSASMDTPVRYDLMRVYLYAGMKLFERYGLDSEVFDELKQAVPTKLNSVESELNARLRHDLFIEVYNKIKS